MSSFNLVSDFTPKGDQPKAIKILSNNILAGKPHQVLLWVTGSGKTFTMAQVIATVDKPTLVMAFRTKPLRFSCIMSSERFFLKMRLSILSAIMITISPKPIFPPATLTSRKIPP